MKYYLPIKANYAFLTIQRLLKTSNSSWEKQLHSCHYDKSA